MPITKTVISGDKIELTISDKDDLEKSNQRLEYSHNTTGVLADQPLAIPQLAALRALQSLIAEEIDALVRLAHRSPTRFLQSDQALISGLKT